ncbi:MAG TPA: prenyltransferase [Desulfotomaculum sp.]|nr:MAG: Putative prenyltransferase [Desulfotomaculum sp. 46_80]HAG12113.1 prenyltransferase [Desulfotomaculum sp.]HBY04934.1 prenyltransferase [Desulfotomaculum sp.]
MEKIQLYFRETRPQFLILTLVCVIVGVAAAYWKASGINVFHLVIILIGALSAHASVNILNDYLDYKSGLDKCTLKTPFSGGSGILPGKQMTPSAALVFGILTFALTALIGVYFLVICGWPLMLVGLPGLILIAFYTQFITRHPLLCLLAPGIGFGPCMVMGTYYVLQGSYDWTSVAASLVPCFLVSNLLLLNQYPDAEVDRLVGRRHFPILIGRTKSTYIYTSFVIAMYICVFAAVYMRLLPPLALISVFPFFIVVKIIKGLLKDSDQIMNIIPLMGQNVIFILLTPLLMAVGLFFSHTF